jgi:DNA-binding SARP family transcriptional activator
LVPDGEADVTLRIRILGPVQILRAGRVVSIRSVKRLAMLAVLALNSNQPVVLEDLTDAVWAEEPPRSAVANLRNYASALRQQIGDRITAHPGGYQLVLQAGELDVGEFRALAANGRAAAAAGDAAAAVGPLADSLALWRGQAGQGLPAGTALAADLASLDEERLGVFDDLIEARLALGQHGQILPLLRRHLHVHPLRERSWAHLMLAQYRSGDTAGALRTFANARAVTREQLGIEPDARLSNLHRAILDRSPELLATPPLTTTRHTRSRPVDTAPVGRDTVRVPHRLPPDLATFTGRHDELAALLAAVRTRSDTGLTAFVLHGPGGVGKSALALHAAHLLADEFPGGHVYIDARWQPPTSTVGAPDELLARTLRALGLPTGEMPTRTEERAEALRCRLSTGRVLILVDNVATAAQVRHLLSADGPSALLVTSRATLSTLDLAARAPVTAPDSHEATAMLAAYAGADRVAAEPGAAADIVRLCDHLPLALRITGTQLAQRPQWPLRLAVQRLINPRHRLDALSHHDLSMRDCLAVAYTEVANLDRLAALVFQRLSGMPTEVSPQETAAATGISAERAWAALELLAEAQLLTATSPGRYQLSRLTRCYAEELARTARRHTAPTPETTQADTDTGALRCPAHPAPSPTISEGPRHLWSAPNHAA